jgi:uncharacterized membrane protein (Fun14 family)
MGAIIGLFVAVLAYLEYQRIVSVGWDKFQTVSQNGITWLANVVTNNSNNFGTTGTGALSNLGISLASRASAGFALGLVRGY